MRNCPLPMLAALPALASFPRARGCPTQSAILSACLHSRILAVGFFQRWPRCLHPLPTRTWLSPAVLSDYSIKCRFLHARGYPLPALGVLSAPAPFPCAGSRPNSSVGYVARTYFPHARGCPLHALGALPAHSLHSRVDAIASFQRWPRCPHPLPARTWLSSSSVGSIVHTRSVPACARLAFRQFPPGKINTKPHANASRGRRRFAARPVRAVAPDISRQLYFQRADFVPPVLHRA